MSVKTRTFILNHNSEAIKELHKGLMISFRKFLKVKNLDFFLKKYEGTKWEGFSKQIEFNIKNNSQNVRFWFGKSDFLFNENNNTLSIPVLGFEKQMFLNPNQFIERIQFNHKSLFVEIHFKTTQGQIIKFNRKEKEIYTTTGSVGKNKTIKTIEKEYKKEQKEKSNGTLFSKI